MARIIGSFLLLGFLAMVASLLAFLAGSDEIDISPAPTPAAVYAPGLLLRGDAALGGDNPCAYGVDGSFAPLDAAGEESEVWIRPHRIAADVGYGCLLSRFSRVTLLPDNIADGAVSGGEALVIALNPVWESCLTAVWGQVAFRSSGPTAQEVVKSLRERSAACFSGAYRASWEYASLDEKRRAYGRILTVYERHLHVLGEDYPERSEALQLCRGSLATAEDTIVGSAGLRSAGVGLATAFRIAADCECRALGLSDGVC